MNTRHERYTDDNASILAEDVWAQEGEGTSTCPRCGAVVVADAARCSACGTLHLRCVGACSACVLRVCVRGEASGGGVPGR